MINKIWHQDLDLRLQVSQISTIDAHPPQHSLIIVDPAQQNDQMAILLLLLYLIEVWYDLSLDMVLVG